MHAWHHKHTANASNQSLFKQLVMDKATWQQLMPINEEFVQVTLNKQFVFTY